MRKLCVYFIIAFSLFSAAAAYAQDEEFDIAMFNVCEYRGYTDPKVLENFQCRDGMGVFNIDVTNEEMQAFLDKLQDAIRRNDKKAFAKIANCSKQRKCIWARTIELDRCEYPRKKTTEIEITSYDEMVRNFHIIMQDQDLRNDILKAKLFKDVRAFSFKGFFVARGGLWFDPDEGILTIHQTIKKRTIECGE